MTTQEKNEQIALMIGWKKGMLGEFVRPSSKPNKEGMVDIIPPFDVKFDSDANLQFEAIEWIEKLNEDDKQYGNIVDICTTHVEIITVKPNYHKILIDRKLTPMTKKEAIFEALYSFAIYLKNS